MTKEQADSYIMQIEWDKWLPVLETGVAIGAPVLAYVNRDHLLDLSKQGTQAVQELIEKINNDKNG